VTGNQRRNATMPVGGGYFSGAMLQRRVGLLLARGQRELDNAKRCSMCVLTEVETLGVARSLGWKAMMDIAKAPGPCGGASIASSSILRRWSARADRTSRFRVWSPA
jgi:hypothetical protein